MQAVAEEPSPLNTQHLTRNASAPSVAVILVNYRGRDDTLECLASLQGLDYPNFSVYVVDQASGDGTLDAVAARFPSAHGIANRENNGFAGGNNVGIRAALESGADYCFLLNNDTTVAPDLLRLLVDRAETRADVGVVGPLMLYHAEPEVVWSAGGTINDRAESGHLRQGERADAAPTEPFAVPFVVGCGLLVKRAVLEGVGLLDERYFLYYEETDFCARVRKAGWQIVTEPRARLWHKISRATGKDSDLTLYYMRRNALLYLRSHAARPALAVLRALADDARLAAVWAARGEAGRRRVLGWAVADFLRNRFGKAARSFS